MVNPSVRKGQRGAGARLNDAQRLEIIEKLEEKPNMRSLAKQYGVDEKVIRNIKKNAADLKERILKIDVPSRGQVFRIQKAHFPLLEDKIYEWITLCRRASISLPPLLIVTKAKQIAVSLGIDEEKFQASWGWYRRFKKRHGLQSILLHGEGDDVDRNNPQTLQELENLYKVISEYDPSCVYNMDETELFYRLLPRYTVLLPSEDITTVRGRKKSKDRVTLIVCTNATGSERVPLTMISKAKEPACIVGRQWPIPYLQQKKAWMDVETFNQWFEQIFRPYVRNRTGRKILLLLDNAPGHASEFERDGIRVAFFPPNVTSWKQPMDMGVIAALKKRYKYLFLKDVIRFHDNPSDVKEQLMAARSRLRRGAAGVEYGLPANLLDAANYAAMAWSDISTQSLKNCFLKADIIPAFRSVQHDEPEVESDAVSELLLMLQSCNISDQLGEWDFLGEELQNFLNLQEESSEAFQESLIEEIDETFNTDLPAVERILEEEMDDLESSPLRSLSAADKRLAVDNVLRQAIALDVDLKSMTSLDIFKVDDIDKCLQALVTVKQTIQDVASKLLAEKVDQSRQMRIHDFGFR